MLLFVVCVVSLISWSNRQFRYSVNPTGPENRPTSMQPSISTSIAASMVRSHSASEAHSGGSGGDTFWRPQSASQQQSSTRPAVTDNFDATLPPRLKPSSAALAAPATAATQNVAPAQHYAVKRIGVCSGHSSYVTHVDFSRDSTLLRSSDGANEVLFWGVPDCVQNPRTISLKDIKWATCTVVYGWDVRSIWPSGSDGTDINAIDVTRDGDAMITADDNGHVKLFRYPAAGDAQMFKAYLGHSSHVLNARFSLDGHRAFTCGGVDAAVIQWRHCDRAFAAPDDFNWIDPKSMPTHSFTVGVYSGPEGGSFDSMWVEVIGPNIRSSRQTLCEKSAIKDALNLNTAATSLPKSSCTTYTISVPSLLAHVIRLGVGMVGKSSSFCDIEKVKIQSPSGQESVFYARNCLNCHMPDTELLPGIENCVKLTLNCVTGDVMNAGTGGSVFICLFDTQGNSSGVRCLRPADTRTNFQRKQTDTFDLFCNPPLGPAASLNVLLEPKVFFKCSDTAVV
jgi:WD40 repeat protein